MISVQPADIFGAVETPVHDKFNFPDSHSGEVKQEFSYGRYIINVTRQIPITGRNTTCLTKDNG